MHWLCYITNDAIVASISNVYKCVRLSWPSEGQTHGVEDSYPMHTQVLLLLLLVAVAADDVVVAICSCCCSVGCFALLCPYAKLGASTASCCFRHCH